MINNKCLCIQGYYAIIGDPICKCIKNIIILECDKTCLTCNGENDNNCLSCSSEYFRILNKNDECLCISGYGYKEGSG